MPFRWFRRLVSLCALGILMLWVAGIARFRDYSMPLDQWLILVAAAFALSVFPRRLRRPQPQPASLPEGANPAKLAAILAAIFGLVAFVVGGGTELLVDLHQPSETSLALRATWHAACAFGAGYCTLLPKLIEARSRGGQRPPQRP
jgi:hypothetical protein